MPTFCAAWCIPEELKKSDSIKAHVSCLNDLLYPLPCPHAIIVSRGRKHYHLCDQYGLFQSRSMCWREWHAGLARAKGHAKRTVTASIQNSVLQRLKQTAKGVSVCCMKRTRPCPQTFFLLRTPWDPWESCWSSVHCRTWFLWDDADVDPEQHSGNWIFMCSICEWNVHVCKCARARASMQSAIQQISLKDSMRYFFAIFTRWQIYSECLSGLSQGHVWTWPKAREINDSVPEVQSTVAIDRGQATSTVVALCADFTK